MRKLYIGLFLLFLAAFQLTAQEIPADAPQWNLTVWVNLLMLINKELPEKNQLP